MKIGICTRFGYIYDFSTLLLSTIIWLSLVRERWRWFLLIYLISCFNKETTLLMSLAFAATQYGRLAPRLFWQLLSYQLLAFTVVRAGLMHAYGTNPGSSVEWHLRDHIDALSRPGAVLLSAVVLVGLARLVAADWRHKPIILRRSLAAIVPPMFGLFILFGYPFEWRVFYEILPLVALLSLPVRAQLNFASEA